VARLNGLIESAKRLVENPALARLLTNLAEGSSSLVPAAKQLDPTLHEVRAMGGRAGELMQETQKLMEDLQPLAADVTRTLDQIDDTARSMRLLADMLERQPQAILRGKGQ
jgi:paraquat-inducible protein B